MTRAGFLACVAMLLWASGCASPGTMNDPSRDLSFGGDASVCGVCQAPTPRCDAMAHRCVACLADEDCPMGSLCRTSACVPGCGPNRPSCGDAGRCDVDLGACRGCASDSDCKDPLLPACDVDGGRCAACSPARDRCPDGAWCKMDGGTLQCAAGCKSDLECQGANNGSASSACCDHLCVNTMTALPHCGACGKACARGACCAGKCTASDDDPAHCGGCGTVCPSRNNTPLCDKGVCATGACTMGFGDCNGKASDGCETSLASDGKNCGACGQSCNLPNTQFAFCAAGKCLIGNCAGGYRDCNADVSDGCEVNVILDSQNCGACGQSCAAVPHAIAGCSGGFCLIASCSTGFADCDRQIKTGCESEILADPANCGGCGRPCPSVNHATSTCMNGMCGLGACAMGFGDCNQKAVDGCEVSVTNDVKSCGSCGNACPGGANAVATCVTGACALTCNPGFGDCDGDPKTGCELPLTADAKNCGACGNSCVMNGMPGMCTAGKCVYGPACANGSYSDCNPQGSTLQPGSAFVDPSPPQGWSQCFGFVNTPNDDVANNALDNCLSTTRLRLKIFDPNGAVQVDIYDEALNSMNAWPASPAYLDGCNCRAQLTLVTCGALWPCQNGAVYYSSTNGTGGGGCGGYNPGGPTLSNGNGGQVTVAITMTDGRELWQGPCYGNQQYVGYKIAAYR